MFVNGVGALADASHAVESGDADAGCEISVGAAADGGFFQFPINLFCDRLRFFVEGGDAGGAFHGKAVDAAVDGELAVFVEGFEGAEFFIKTRGLLCFLDADVDFYGGFGGDYVGAGAAADHAGVHRDSTLQVVELRDGGNLAREFEDGAVSLAGVEAGVGGDAFHRQRVIADTFAGGLYGTASSGGGLEHEYSCGVAGEGLGNFARRRAADFFVGD